MDKGRGGGSDNVDKVFLYVLGLFESSFGLFNAYFVVFGLFLPKTEENKNVHVPKMQHNTSKVFFSKNNNLRKF